MREKYPTVKAVSVYARADARILRLMAEAVKTGKLVIPIGATMSLANAAKAHAAAEAWRNWQGAADQLKAGLFSRACINSSDAAICCAGLLTGVKATDR